MLIAVRYGFSPLLILQFLRQHLEIVGFLTTLSIVVSAWHLKQYSAKDYEKMIVERIQNVERFSRYFNRKTFISVSVEEWRKGVCELLYDSLTYLNLGEREKMYENLTKLREVLEFTANSDFSYYVRLTLKTANNLDSAFLRRKSQQISEITRFKWISPSISPKIYLFLKSMVREIDREFLVYESDLIAAFFSKDAAPSTKEEYLNTRRIACSNFHIWQRCYIDSAKYEMLIDYIVFFGALLGLVLTWTSLAIGLFLTYYLIFQVIYSGKSGFRSSPVKDSLEFLAQILNCDDRGRVISQDLGFHRARELILASGIIDSVNWLDEMTDEQERMNLSVLVYLLTTFPKCKLVNFVPMRTQDLPTHFELEEIPEWDIVFALVLPIRYLKSLFLKLFRKNS